MAFLEINGWSIPAANGRVSVSYEKLGAVGRSYMGKLLGTRRAKVRRWSVETTIVEPGTATAIEHLINGAGQVWSFDRDLYSSKGLGPQSGYSVTVSATGGKYGGHVEVASGTSLIYDPNLGGVPYTVLVWKEEGGVWYHYGINSSGTQYKNGAAHTAIPADDVTNWFTQSLTTFAIEGKDIAGANAAAKYDDFLIVPYLMPLAQISAVYNLGAAHPTTPQIRVGGDIVSQDLSVVHCIGDVGSSQYVQGATGGSFQSNLHRLSFTLNEVDQAGRP